jgi:hypothetical protein
MAAGQLWLFNPPSPFTSSGLRLPSPHPHAEKGVECLGEDFFRALPSDPGVYLMCGVSEGVLYVGKARNLRKRLSSYRVANPERLPRRIIRPLHRVTRIEFDVCLTEEAARHREELLICVLTPKFNAAGKVWELRAEGRSQKSEVGNCARATGNQRLAGLKNGRAEVCRPQRV